MTIGEIFLPEILTFWRKARFHSEVHNFQKKNKTKSRLTNRQQFHPCCLFLKFRSQKITAHLTSRISYFLSTKIPESLFFSSDIFRLSRTTNTPIQSTQCFLSLFPSIYPNLRISSSFFRKLAAHRRIILDSIRRLNSKMRMRCLGDQANKGIKQSKIRMKIDLRQNTKF